MPAEDKYGPQLQRWFETHAVDEPRSVHDAVNAIGCSRQRVYQWLSMGAHDIVEVSRSTRGAALMMYKPGARRRLSVGAITGGTGVMVGGLGGVQHGDAASTAVVTGMTVDGSAATILDVRPGERLLVVGVRLLVGGGEVELERADGSRILVTAAV